MNDKGFNSLAIVSSFLFLRSPSFLIVLLTTCILFIVHSSSTLAMNTAARIESTSECGKIQLSQETANLLFDAGKQKWLLPRKDKINAKGKGDLQTYWLVINHQDDDCGSTRDNSSTMENGDATINTDDRDEKSKDGDWAYADTPTDDGNAKVERVNTSSHSRSNGIDGRTSRLIDWNVGMLLQLIKQIIARRNATSSSSKPRIPKFMNTMNSSSSSTDYDMPLEEVKEIITLPEFDSKAARRQQDPETVVVPELVESQLRDYVTCIAELYNENSFHNFDHASHVVMSVIKLMSRIVAPTSDVLADASEHNSGRGGSSAGGSGSDTDSRTSYSTMKSANVSMSIKHQRKKLAASLHDHTYGIVSISKTESSGVLKAFRKTILAQRSNIPFPTFLMRKSSSEINELRRATRLLSSHAPFRHLSMMLIIQVFLIHVSLKKILT